jgi:hypothetical protein
MLNVGQLLEDGLAIDENAMFYLPLKESDPDYDRS